MKRIAFALLLASCGGRLVVDVPDPAPSSAPSQPAIPASPPGTRDASPHAADDASDGADFDAGSVVADAAADAESDAPACTSSDDGVAICYAHAAPPQWSPPRPCVGVVTRERDGAVETREAGLARCWRVVDDGDAGERAVWCCPD